MQRQAGILCLQIENLAESNVLKGQKKPIHGMLFHLDFLPTKAGAQSSRVWQHLLPSTFSEGQFQPRDFQVDVNDQGKGVIGFVDWVNAYVYNFDLSIPVVPVEKREAVEVRRNSSLLEPRQSQPYHLAPGQFVRNKEEKLILDLGPLQLKSLKQEGPDLLLTLSITICGDSRDYFFRRDKEGGWTKEGAKYEEPRRDKLGC